jgi:hypothetical protein
MGISMIGLDLTKFASWPYRIGAFLVLSALAWGAREADKAHQRSIGAAAVTKKIEAGVSANAELARKVRDSVKSYPSEKLKDKWTRD